MIPITEQRTKADMMNEVNAILTMVAKKKGVKVSDLEWKKDKDLLSFLTVFKENHNPDFKGKTEIEGWGVLLGFKKRF